MKEKKNIDKLFKEQFKNFEVAPNDTVWEHIEQELHKDKRKKRRIIPIWWKVAGIAAILALLFTVGNLFFENNTSNNGINTNTVVDDANPKNNDTENKGKTSQDNDTKELFDDEASEKVTNSNMTLDDNDVENTSERSSNKSQKSTVTTPNTKKSDALVSSDKTFQNTKKESNGALVNSNNENIKNNSVANNKTERAIANTNTNGSIINKNQSDRKKEDQDADVLIKDVKNSYETSVTNITKTEKETIEETNKDEDKSIDDAIEKAIAEAEDTSEKEEEEEKLNRWSVSPNVAPVYFSSLGKKGSTLDDQFIDNTKEGDINMSYGINGGYAINKKLKIRAGVNKVQLGYKTDNILIFDNAIPISGAARQIENVTTTDSISSHSIYSASNFKLNSVPASIFTKEQGSIDQQLGFIEVPLELEYNLVDKKIGLNVIGGFSTLFLSDNDVYLVENSGERTRLGEANNIKDMSYSANFGIGIDYNITKQLQINLEPKFKYQINTFNNTSGDFKPFFIGVYSGLSFKF